MLVILLSLMALTQRLDQYDSVQEVEAKRGSRVKFG